MGHGHSHGEIADVEVGQRARATLIGFLSLVGVLAVAGMIWLWPSSSELSAALQKVGDAPGVTYEQATINSVVDGCEDAIGSAACKTASVTINGGDFDGETADVVLSGGNVNNGLRTGDTIEIARVPNGADDVVYSFSGVNRMPVLIGLAVLFSVAVVAVARLRGVLALVGLAAGAWILLGFMLPSIIVGKPGMAVALAGSIVIMLIMLYLTHGISLRTSAALAGTLLGLAVITGLGAVSVQLARLSGFADENEYDLSQLAPAINFQDLFMVAIIIGGLGVLNDVTITQASAVWELRAAAPQWTRLQVFNAGMRIGRDHIASTIYTIVFAYAGSALTIMLLLYFTARDTVALLGQEMFAGEIVRTFASAIGLILAVPITTGIAALTLGPARADAEAAPATEASVPRHSGPATA